MCVAIPGLVVSVENTVAVVDFSGNKVRVELGLVNAKPGDYVLVHAGCATTVLDKENATELMKLLAELEEAVDG